MGKVLATDSQGGEVMCEYCENMKPLIGDEQDGACIENGNILVAYGECSDCAKGRINYCPMCGRNLKENK